MTSQRRLEFWPDYAGVLLHDAGVAVPLQALPLSAETMERAVTWVASYDDTRLDAASRDEAWITEGRAIFAIIRDHLGRQGIDVFDWEGIWSTDSD